MANICDNQFYASSSSKETLEFIKKFINSNFEADIDSDGDSIEILFTSRWVFPEELMNRLYDSLPNKEDIYMRCLSVEWGCYYHAMWVCNENGWNEV